MSFVDAARSESNFQMSKIKYEAEASALIVDSNFTWKHALFEILSNTSLLT